MTTSIASLTALRKELAERGYYHKATVRIVLELAAGFGVFSVGTAIFVWSSHLLIQVFAILISTIGSLVVATNTHTSSHYATSRAKWVNELLTFIGYPLFLGLSATFWWYKHVVVHHPAPNIAGVDDDADLLPWFAMTRDEIEKSKGFRRLYYEKVQCWFFPFALAGNGFNLQRSSWVYLLRRLRQRNGRNGVFWVDVTVIILHYLCWLAIPLYWFPPVDVLGFYALRIGLMGYAMYSVLAPGHFPAEATALFKEATGSDYALLQTATTVNFRTSIFGRWVCSGLQYQIEHHLFPNLSHTYYPKASVLVQEFCLKHGLPYRSYGWAEVLWKSWLVLRKPKPVEKQLSRLSILS